MTLVWTELHPAGAGTGGGRKRRFAASLLPLVPLALLVLANGCGGGAGEGGTTAADSSSVASAPADLPSLRKEVEELRRDHAKLQDRVVKLVPKDPYVVVNTTMNRLELRQGSETLLDAACSTGSNTELVDKNGRRRWFFSTPRGVFSVRNKMLAPTWIKPDWAFVEEGEPVPGARADERYEEGVLGKYGLYFGDGYLIHGTLFGRFLGQSVTHGCVRLGDDDLETVYKKSKVGTKIYIY